MNAATAIRAPRNAAIVVVVLHLVGLAGLLSPWANRILPLTPYNLMITAGLLLLHARPDRRTWLFAGLVALLGFLVEVAGVHSGIIFGEYAYGSTLGIKLLNVPLLIGVNWMVLVLCLGPLIDRTTWPTAWKVVVASSAMVLLDMLIEPAAIHLGYWQWEEGLPPVRNYVAWGLISAVFFTLFYTMPVRRQNPMAVHVLLTMALFFAGLNIAVALA